MKFAVEKHDKMKKMRFFPNFYTFTLCLYVSSP